MGQLLEVSVNINKETRFRFKKIQVREEAFESRISFGRLQLGTIFIFRFFRIRNTLNYEFGTQICKKIENERRCDVLL